MSTYTTSLYIFRRDLRLEDNRALIAACQSSKTVIACFVLDPSQIDSCNTYASLNAIQFMIASLQDLQKQLEQKGGKLYLFHTSPLNALSLLKKEHTIDALFLNKDYTPFSTKRDKLIEDFCKKEAIAYIALDDYVLNAPQATLKKDGKPYSIFTPYWKTASKQPVLQPVSHLHTNFFNGTIQHAQDSNIFTKILPTPNKDIAQQGGRASALVILKNIAMFHSYSKTHDIPSLATTQLSAHIKFGTVSIREIYWNMLKKIGQSAHTSLIRQLYWHDFYYQIAYNFPHVFGSAFHTKYNKIAWSYNKKHFDLWCQGQTGFPIVDAGMRQLNQTGYMHNRVRMIVASFLTKDLLIDWQWGEKYFAQHLVDYDPCINNGNWQWAASTGCDPQPYFRIFNPWLQQKKFDPQCIYIKTWIKELTNVDNKIIHNWISPKSPKLAYPRPIVDHKVQKELALKMFKATLTK